MSITLTREAMYSYRHPTGKVITLVRLRIPEFTKPVQWEAYIDGMPVIWNDNDPDAKFSSRRSAYKHTLWAIEGPSVYGGDRMWDANIDQEMRNREIKKEIVNGWTIFKEFYADGPSLFVWVAERPGHREEFNRRMDATTYAAEHPPTNTEGAPAMGKITTTIEADKEGFLGFLAEQRDTHKRMAEGHQTQKGAARERGIAEGLELAMHFVEDWVLPS